MERMIQQMSEQLRPLGNMVIQSQAQATVADLKNPQCQQETRKEPVARDYPGGVPLYYPE